MIEEKAKDILVPTLLLQPLVENAFKHGISKLETRGLIRLRSFLKGDDFVIELENSIPNTQLKLITNSTKIGLENLKNRLLQVYGDNHAFSTKKEHDVFKVSIAIPKTLDRWDFLF